MGEGPGEGKCQVESDDGKRPLKQLDVVSSS